MIDYYVNLYLSDSNTDFKGFEFLCVHHLQISFSRFLKILLESKARKSF